MNRSLLAHIPTAARRIGTVSVVLSLFCGALHARASAPVAVHVDWDKTIADSRATPTLQVIPNAMTRKGEPFHDIMYTAIRTLDAQYVRFMPWGPYPHMQIPALRAPTAQKTYWDFTHIDPQIVAFFAATRGKEPFVNFSSIPPWMLTDFKQYAYPKDPNQMDWGWLMPTSGDPRAPRTLKDPTGKQLAEYYARIVSWYTKGGFHDENGRFHRSGHRFDIPWWGVLNEHDYMLSAQEYTKVYDAITSAIRKVSPSTRFLALEMVGTDLPRQSNPDYFEYFLNPKNHAPGVSIDMMAYHFYAHGGKSENLDAWQHTFFSQADGFLREVDYIEAIRKRLSPETKVYLDELGSQVPDAALMPPEYWNLSAALFAYLYAELAKRDIDAVGQAGFLFYPGNFPSVTMMDWNTGQLNARFHVSKLLKDHFGPGDRLKLTSVADNFWLPSTEDVYAQAFETTQGRKILLVNKRSSATMIAIEEQGGGKTSFKTLSVVDSPGGYEGARQVAISENALELQPFAVAVLSQDLTNRSPT